jgi:prephenate dehydrogenase
MHVGVLKELSPDFLLLGEGKQEIRLKLSNVEILSKSEIKSWKIDNLTVKSFDVSIIFPDTCDPKIIAISLESIDGVVSSKVLDIYSGDQISSDSISVTIRYEVFDSECVKTVETFLKGFGGLIR